MVAMASPASLGAPLPLALQQAARCPQTPTQLCRSTGGHHPVRPSGGAPFTAILLTPCCCIPTPSPHRPRLRLHPSSKQYSWGGPGGPARSSAVPLHVASQLCRAQAACLCSSVMLLSACLSPPPVCNPLPPCPWQCSGHRPGPLLRTQTSPRRVHSFSRHSIHLAAPRPLPRTPDLDIQGPISYLI